MSKTSASGRFSRFPAVNREEATGTDPAAEEAVPDLSKLTVAQVIEWAGSDDSKRALALAAEQAGKNRKTIVDALSS